MEDFKDFVRKLTLPEWMIIVAIIAILLALIIPAFTDNTVNDRRETRSADRDRSSGTVTCYSGGELVYSKRATGITSVYRNEFNFFDTSGTLVTASITMCMIERKESQQ